MDCKRPPASRHLHYLFTPMGVCFPITLSAFTPSSLVLKKCCGWTEHRPTSTTSPTSWRRQLTLRIGTFRQRFRRILIPTLLPVLVPACLIIAGFAQSPPSSTLPPSYQSLRYDEDW